MYFLINLRSRSVTMIIDDNVTIFILNKALNAQASYLSHNEMRFISAADKNVSTLTSVRLQSQKDVPENLLLSLYSCPSCSSSPCFLRVYHGRFPQMRPRDTE